MQPIYILYGTETYNSEGLAERTGEAIRERGLQAVVLDMDEFDHALLPALSVLLIVTSTFGAGEPPANAEEFHGFLMGASAPALPRLRFSVCGLGDTAYDDFCQCGKDFDARLEQLGATRIAPRQDCDTDFESPWERWLAAVLHGLSGLDLSAPAAAPAPQMVAQPVAAPVAVAAQAPMQAMHQPMQAMQPMQPVMQPMQPVMQQPMQPAMQPVMQPVLQTGWQQPSWQPAMQPMAPQQPPAEPLAAEQPAAPAKKPAKLGSRKNPFFATVIENYNLNHPSSKKETRHVSLSLEGSPIEYKVGDSLGLFPRNCPDLVRRILSAVDIPRDTPVHYEGEWYTIRDVCIYKRDVMQIDRRMLALAEFGQNANRFAPILADKRLQTNYVADHQLIDFVTAAGLRPDPQEFIDCLRPLAPRLYSIASSPKAHPGEVHLCVDVLRYELFGSMRKGVSSTFLGERAGPGVEIAVYLQETKDFMLCGDDLPIILIGPGTGIAPMRAFLEEREARGARGQSWLFFGSQHEATDFLYREQLEKWVESGLLARLDTAFSRDQEQKIYVQDRMYDARAALWTWLEAGAYVYICGDANRMAKDVHAMFCRIIAECGGLDPDAAEGYMQRLNADKRYLKDVY